MDPFFTARFALAVNVEDTVAARVMESVPSVALDILSPFPKVRSLPEIVISSLNDAAPALDISNVNAVTVVQPSFPLKIISLSDTFAVITKSLELFVKVPINVPPSLILTSAPSASRTTSAGESSVTAPDDVDIVTAASPVVISSAAEETPVCAYVFNLEAVIFLFVPPAPSSIINKSASIIGAPISVPPSISKAANPTLLAVLIVASLESAIAAL